jgi:putative transposase
MDGLWVKVKEERVRDMVILFVLGITRENKKEIVGFKLARGESEDEATSLLNDLYRRGLEGKHLKVISSDGCKGIRAAINTVYPYARWQLCYTHKLRNLSDNIRYKRKHRKEMMKQASEIYQSGSRKEAIRKFNQFCLRWQDLEPYAIRCFQKDFHQTLVYFEFKDDKNLVGTTNHLERDLEEVRRRIKIQGYFKSQGSLNLWVYGIITQFRIDKNVKSQGKEKQQPRGMPKLPAPFQKTPQHQSAHFP